MPLGPGAEQRRPQQRAGRGISRKIERPPRLGTRQAALLIGAQRPGQALEIDQRQSESGVLRDCLHRTVRRVRKVVRSAS